MSATGKAEIYISKPEVAEVLRKAFDVAPQKVEHLASVGLDRHHEAGILRLTLPKREDRVTQRRRLDLV